MSRRTCSLLSLAGIAIAVATGMYAPEHLYSDDPEYAAEVVACLDPREDVAGAIAKSDQEAFIEVTIRAASMPKLTGSHQELPPRGVVKDLFPFLDIVAENPATHIMQAPRTVTLNGQSFFFPASIHRPVLSDDGVTTIIVESGFKAKGTPTLCQDGKIHLQFEAWLMCTHFAPIQGEGSFLLEDGQTCFIGGMTRKMKGFRYFEVPFLTRLPAIGDTFRTSREIEVDTEILFLATPKFVSGTGGNTQ